AAGKPGEELTVIAAQTVGLAGAVYVGIGVSSHDANILETAIFSNVRLEQRPAAAPQQGYRSKVTVYDLAARSTRVVYQADQIVEAPNWSRDGSFLLINTGGSLYRLPAKAAGKPKRKRSSWVKGGIAPTTITICRATASGWPSPLPARRRGNRRSGWRTPMARAPS